MTYREIYDIAVPPHKRKEERWNIFAGHIGRPISVLMTVPLSKTSIKPTTVTGWSLIALIIGAILVSIHYNMTLTIIGWFFFLLWNLLDGVDGNLARSTNQCSNLGDLWDTMGGYSAMVLTYFSAGIAAYFDNSLFDFCDKYLLLIFGGATAIMSIFPRLVMQKKKTYGVNSEAVNKLTDKTHFGIKQIISMNLISPSGFLQVIFLLCIIFHCLNFFISIYMLINFLIMIFSLYSLLKQ
ncbi:CDP-alcohol phosphatidyltransferase family protein [Prevotella sp. P5-50]|uniref:CDP-alcohol phosphatidyltransferase family protein n=1 Tax=Prevotella sp. P5-50 TaxID=2024217 RepID=UPI000B96AC13|nr:CDP-alcohol phosphatidyltransferase family protein [Prevotella sp. P5-50]OYP41228.1 hypothetical protein CIK88_06770 [Prevotella sp. P5-50]